MLDLRLEDLSKNCWLNSDKNNKTRNYIKSDVVTHAACHITVFDYNYDYCCKKYLQYCNTFYFLNHM